MVGHQAKCQDRDRGVSELVAQQVEVDRAIVRGEENINVPITALGDVKREARVDEAGSARHVIGVVALATGCSQPVVTLLPQQTVPDGRP